MSIVRTWMLMVRRNWGRLGPSWSATSLIRLIIRPLGPLNTSSGDVRNTRQLFGTPTARRICAYHNRGLSERLYLSFTQTGDTRYHSYKTGSIPFKKVTRNACERNRLTPCLACLQQSMDGQRFTSSSRTNVNSKQYPSKKFWKPEVYHCHYAISRHR
jgi:hypothetical protein